MFTEELWNEWVEKESQNYKLTKQKETGKLVPKYLKKGYLHLDDKFWFPERKDELKALLKNPKLITSRSFFPFIKIILKTPRFKYNETTDLTEVDFKPRPICFASHTDSLIYSFYSHILTKEYENYIVAKKIDSCVLAYRTDLNMCNIDFANEVFTYIKNKGECVVIALDVKGFFDNLNHKIIQDNWAVIIGANKPTELPEDQYHIFKTLTKYNYINKTALLKGLQINLDRLKPKPNSILDIINEKGDKEKFKWLRNRNIIVTNQNKYGIPQGSPMSALLSNIYMIDYDSEMLQLAEEKEGLYRRYCDDILFVCHINDVEDIKDRLYKRIEDIKLIIQPKKEEVILFKTNSEGQIRSFDYKKIKEHPNAIIENTNETTFYKRLQYLGFEFNGQDIFIRPSSLSRYFRKMKARVTKTVKMAYSPRSKGKKIFKKKLIHRYTHVGKRNFISYAINAASKSYFNSKGEEKKGMDSLSIKKQISRHFDILMKDLEKKNIDRAKYKLSVRKLKHIKR
jgi:RNA-directed DNA polymerase